MKKFLLVLMALLLFAFGSIAETAYEVEYHMSALITAVEADSFTVQWADGREYTFKTSEDIDMDDLTGGLEAGKTAFISYTGDIDWENCDTSAARVTYISDGDMDDIDYISGVVADASMHNIVIEWVNGKEYSFFVGGEVDKSGLDDEGVIIDGVVKIGYIGMVDWEQGDNSLVHVVSLAKGEVETVNEVTGTVYDAAMHSLVLETEDGEQYAFSDNGDVDKSGLADGVVLGQKVKISFVGSLEYPDYMHMVAIVDAE